MNGLAPLFVIYGGLWETRLAVLAAPAVTRRWPRWGRVLFATVLIASITALQVQMAGAGYPFLTYLAAVVVCAVLFDEATSLYATILSGACLDFFFLEPRYSFWIESSSSAFAFAFFVLLCLFVGFLIELLHLAVRRLHDANEALRAANRELTASDQEKDLLLREAAHRTKNDLLTLIAIIRLEQRRHQDERISRTLDRLAQRTQVYVKLQERLSRAEQESVVNAGAYLKDLCEELASALSGASAAALRICAEDHILPAQQAVALGLITNELVTNAFKHAFADDHSGTVEVVFRATSEGFVLCVEDNGRGLREPEPRGAGLGGHGQGLVKGMVSQLQGEIELKPRADGRGTIARVEFPCPNRVSTERAAALS
jgi:two-component system, sensor histidine kinase PdtaS